MRWVKFHGLSGKVYQPDGVGQVHKKHPCRTCFTCQWCDENRCRVCQSDGIEFNDHSAAKHVKRQHGKKSLSTNERTK
jgi:hypothetical protein